MSLYPDEFYNSSYNLLIQLYSCRCIYEYDLILFSDLGRYHKWWPCVIEKPFFLLSNSQDKHLYNHLISTILDCANLQTIKHESSSAVHWLTINSTFVYIAKSSLWFVSLHLLLLLLLRMFAVVMKVHKFNAHSDYDD